MAGAATLTTVGLAAPALAFRASGAGGATQVVQGHVDAQFGVAVGPDGSASPSATTIPYSVTRTVEDGVPVLTIAPRG
jgi:hypothetical protein